MKNLNELHEKAMELADRAFLAKGKKDLESFARYSREAMQLEREAAGLLKGRYDLEPTRSILYRSAATLALDCEAYQEAKQLCQEGLHEKTPEMIKDEIDELMLKIAAMAKVCGSELSVANPEKSIAVIDLKAAINNFSDYEYKVHAINCRAMADLELKIKIPSASEFKSVLNFLRSRVKIC